MALNNVIRRAASRVVPLAIRASAASQRYLHHHHGAACPCCAAVTQPSLNFFPRVFPSVAHHYSTKPKSDESLVRVIKSEIQCAIDTQEEDEVEVPEGFPFKIEDHPGQQTITLLRDYNGESISVEVHMPDISGEEDENEKDDDGDAQDDEQGSQSCIPLVVRVSKQNGPSLEFTCTAYADEIAIDSLSIKDPNTSEEQVAYEGPDFGDLDENLQKSFHKFLEIRGIKPSTTNFLHEYMINKDSREYVAWLENLQKFVEA
ncbi:hypothetical protein SASPL_120784 [Salvia splendens]|uniref:Mitochondrial glycoprotein n=1 Tax=Salvia splendens TaxID=180675 RepID=A0A8X8XUX2_SALSN|nr:uncharacterized protein At2g39795, mitochondrial-like [Salvia splendens]KAG6418580.1 hypothetical protein SASPL_120784 [Salvia splendens]